MKTTLQPAVISALCVMTFSSIAQSNDDPKVGDAWKLTQGYTFTKSNVNGNAIQLIPFVAGFNQIESAPSGSKFSIIGINDTSYIIRFWNWPNNTEVTEDNGEQNRSKRNRLNLNGNNQQYFLFERKRFSGLTKRLYRRFTPTLGFLSYPFKYYPQEKGRVEKAFSISVTGGYRMLFNNSEPEHAIAALLGVGPTTISLNSENSNIAVDQKDQEAGAASLSFNLVYIHERLQIGLSIGADKIINGNPNGWRRDGNLWFGLGVGVSIFAPDKSVPTSQSN